MGWVSLLEDAAKRADEAETQLAEAASAAEIDRARVKAEELRRLLRTMKVQFDEMLEYATDPGNPVVRAEELARLRTENADLRREVERLSRASQRTADGRQE